MYLIKTFFCKSIILFSLVAIGITAKSVAGNLIDNDSAWTIKKQNYSINIVKKGFRYSILKPGGQVILQAHPASGLELANSQIINSRLISRNNEHAEFIVTNDIGIEATVRLSLSDNYFKMFVRYTGDHPIAATIVSRTQGLAPAYGLADNAAFRDVYSTELSGFKDYYFGARPSGNFRLISNFIIFPKQGLACINLEPRKKIIKITEDELIQGSYYTSEMPAMYYFIGSPKQIYSDYLHVRNEEGYKVYMPKYEWFGVGWEAFGALGWHTNYQTVTEDVEHYLNAGFPLRWMVVGSGFWPNDDPRYFATTSFGHWDKTRYPDPKGFIENFHQKGLKFILGLRIAFIPNGPFTEEGLRNGYFIKKDGSSRLFKVGFPKTDCYFLNASNAKAVEWYVGLCDKWKAAGVDGYKEDLYGYEVEGFPDDKLDPVNALLMDKGIYVMGRNGYVGSPMDIQRFNDFNYNQNQDRGPVNGLAYAYSGFPYVYPDIIGGTGLTNKQFGDMEKEKIGKYLMRESQYAAVNPSMSFGYGPWNLNNDEAMKVCLSAAQLHDRLHDYIYSAAVRTYLTGFPYTMTPLPLAYPLDSTTYYRGNDKVRGYQWLLGDALMAIPLYGNDYGQSNTRDIYLPAGKWIDYDNGKVYQGPSLLKDFTIPVDKTPLLVGGTGFVIEKIEGKLMGRIYPVGFSGETVFYDKDGKTKSVISIEGPFDKVTTVKDETIGKKVKVQYNRFAYEFEFIPGHNYKVN